MALMDSWSPPPALHYSCCYCLFVHSLVPSCRLEMGWGLQGDSGVRGCQTLASAPPAAPAEQGDPTLSSFQLHNPPKHSEAHATPLGLCQQCPGWELSLWHC